MSISSEEIKSIIDTYKYRINGVAHISNTSPAQEILDFYKSICGENIQVGAEINPTIFQNFIYLNLVGLDCDSALHKGKNADILCVVQRAEEVDKVNEILSGLGFTCIRQKSSIFMPVETIFVRKILPKLTLAIPTYKRYSYLKEFLPHYYNNPYIHEIVINDEDGSDNQLIFQHLFNKKLRLFSNTKRLYVYLNKHAALNNASNKWVCLFDSDNFAPLSYFDAWGAAFEDDSRIIYAPCRTLPQKGHGGFNFRNLQDMIVDKNNYKKIYKLPNAEICLNAANFIVCRETYLNAKCFSGGGKSHSLDTLYKNYLMFHLCDARMKIVPRMEYYHAVHDESSWAVMLKETDTEYYNTLYKEYTGFEMTLFEWQRTIKPRSEWLYNCSECDKINDEWVPFSIGMGWNIINFTGEESQIQIGTHENLLLCAVQDWTDQRRRPLPQNRRSILATLKEKGIENINLPYQEYFPSLPCFKFVISPEGNGIDCHRHYEALMAGAIPIVEDHPGIREKYAGCPILFTKDYIEITPEYLLSKYQEMLHTKYDFSRLLFSAFDTTSKKEIKRNGNYWAQRHFNLTWYKD